MKRLQYTIFSALLLTAAITWQACNKTEAPAPAFEASKTEISAGEKIDFTDLSENEPTQWAWSFEGGIPFTSSEKDPSGVLYNTPGVYAVSLVVSNEAGSNTKTISDYITVKESDVPPSADFEASATSIFTGEEIDFTSLSVGATTWAWSFEGGTPETSTEQNPKGISYATAGTYNVTLIASNGQGSDTKTISDYITVGDKGTAPSANFKASETSIDAGGAIDFTDLSVGATSWSWSFEGGTPNTSTDQNPTGILYETAGKFSVTLTASNSVGSNEHSKTAYITVANDLAPVVNFSAGKTEISEGGTIDFTDESSLSPTVWEWTFEGGSPSKSYDRNPAGILYDVPGTYSVTLLATNKDGSASKTEVDYITVTESPIKKMQVVSNAVLLKSGATNCPPAGGWGWNVFANVVNNSQNKIPFTYYSANFVSRDFINAEGNVLDNYLGVSGWPSFFVGGKSQKFSQMQLGSGATEASLTTQLEDMITDVVESDPLTTAAVNWYVDDNTIFIDSYVGFLKEARGDYYVAIWVSEDKVWAAQAGHPNGTAAHRHVLRTAADKNEVFGIKLNDKDISANTLFTNSHRASFPEGVWDKNNATVTAVIFKKVGNTYYVVNASSEIYEE